MHRVQKISFEKQNAFKILYDTLFSLLNFIKSMAIHFFQEYDHILIA